MSINLIETAYANTAGAPADSGAISTIIMFMGLILIFYFLIWRPQSKRAREHRDLISNLAKGDEIITSGGLLGSIVKITDNFIVLNVSDNLQVNVQKHAVAKVVPKGTMAQI